MVNGGNLMAGSLVSIEVGGLKYILDTATETLLFLSIPAYTTATHTLHKANNTNYQVTTGKTFKCLGALVSGGTVAVAPRLLYADNADGTTNAVDIQYFQAPDADNVDQIIAWIPTPTMPTAPADKFVNATITADQGIILGVIGIES